MKTLRSIWAILFALPLALACELEAPPDEGPGNGAKLTEIRDGVFRVDASEGSDWVFVDLDNTSEAEESGGWDLAFQRTLIAANGEAGVLVARLDDVDFDTLETAPEEGYHKDGERPSGETDGRGGGGEGLAFHDGDDWYDYDMASHLLAPKTNRVYVVLSTEGKAFALRMIAYYDEAGTGGFPTFEMKEIEAPTEPIEPEPWKPNYPEDAITIDASDEEEWVYFDLDTQEIVDASADWELAFRRMWIATNGAEGVQVAILDEHKLDDVSEAPEGDYLMDDFEFTEEALPDLAFHLEGGWYDYDLDTHRLSAKERVYVIVSAEEKAFAVQLLGYYDEEGNDGHPTFRMKELKAEEENPEVGTKVVMDATSEEDWVYFDLDTGVQTEVDGGWDLAFQRMWIATNGAEGVEVAILDGLHLSEVETPPAEGYLVDDFEITEETRMDLAFHQEEQWYEYTPQHKLLPRERVYVVISTEGRAFGVQMVSYYDDAEASAHPTFRYLEIE